MAVPAVADAIAAGRPLRAVWINELGGVTFSIARGPDGFEGSEYVKVYPDEHAHLLIAEAHRLARAVRYAAVPEVLDAGPGWLHTAGLPGRSAVDRHWGARTAHRGAPRADRLVVCHGGHEDLGLADRWADLAIASMSLDWNYPTDGPDGFAEILFDASGVTADTERIAYYRRSWD